MAHTSVAVWQFDNINSSTVQREIMAIATSSIPRLGLIGCGAIAMRQHVPALKRLKWPISVMVDRDLDRISSYSKRLGNPVITASLDEAIDHLDAAIVATPHSTHHPLCMQLLKAGKHVFVEKPMAMNQSECREMVKATDHGSKFVSLAIGLMRRQLQLGEWVEGAISNGILGEITEFHFSDGGPYGWPVATDSFWRKETAGGGVLMDTGAHTLDQMIWWLGMPEKVKYRDDALGGVEADCELSLILPNGAEGKLELSRTRPMRGTAVIRGSKGAFEINLVKNIISATDDSLLDFEVKGAAARSLPSQGYGDLYLGQIADWLDSIKSVRPAKCSGEEAAKSVELIEVCYRDREPLDFPWSTYA